MIGTHRAARKRESCAGDGAAQVVVRVAVVAGKRGSGESKNLLHLGRSPSLPEQALKAKAGRGGDAKARADCSRASARGAKPARVPTTFTYGA